MYGHTFLNLQITGSDIAIIRPHINWSVSLVIAWFFSFLKLSESLSRPTFCNAVLSALDTWNVPVTSWIRISYFHLLTCWSHDRVFFPPPLFSGSSCSVVCVLCFVFTSLAKEVMFLVALVCLSVCLFVCEQHYSKSYERIGMKFYGRVLSSTSKNWLNFGGDLGIVRWVNEQKNTVIVVAYPDRGEGNDPEPFFFFFFFFLGGWVVFHKQGSTFLQWTIWE